MWLSHYRINMITYMKVKPCFRVINTLKSVQVIMTWGYSEIVCKTDIPHAM